MNPIFGPDGWPNFPRKSYARLDATEPTNLTGASEAVFAFDAIDATWSEINSGGEFFLSTLRSKETEALWRSLFRVHGLPRRSDPFASAQIFRIEISVKTTHQWFEKLSAVDEFDWVEIDLDDTGVSNAQVYGGLFALPVDASLASIIKVSPKVNGALSHLFSMPSWPKASEADIRRALGSLGSLDYLTAYDVGQGSANGLLDTAESAQLYFDLGGGAYGNLHTRPTPLRFCWRANAPVVLSHWDTDHWAGEAGDPLAQGRTWIAPRQAIGPSHAAFVSKILSAGGTVLIWARKNPKPISIATAGGQTLTLAHCTGKVRNDSGISCVVTDTIRSEGWLLTGDAPYNKLGQGSLPQNLRAVVVPHHGADMGSAVKNTPPARPGGYTRLIYSFGPGNRHGRTAVQHPTAVAIAAHAAWNHGAWISAPPASTSKAGGDVLATADNPSPAQPSGVHHDAAVVGWSAPPLVPFATVPCGLPNGPIGCTGAIRQS